MNTENTTSRKRAKPRKQRSHVMVTLPPEVRRGVEQLAEQEDRSLASVCRRFVEQGLANNARPQKPGTEKY